MNNIEEVRFSYLPPLQLPFPRASHLPQPSVNLSEISQANIHHESDEFVISDKLLTVIRNSHRVGHDAGALSEDVINEATEYANRRKKNARSQLKERQRRVEPSLNTIEKGKLRSRREARVHKIKEKALESALKDALSLLIAELPHFRSVNGSINNLRL